MSKKLIAVVATSLLALAACSQNTASVTTPTDEAPAADTTMSEPAATDTTASTPAADAAMSADAASSVGY